MNSFKIGDKLQFYVTDDYYRDTIYEVRGFVDDFPVVRYPRWVPDSNGYTTKLEYFYLVFRDTSSFRKVN